MRNIRLSAVSVGLVALAAGFTGCGGLEADSTSAGGVVSEALSVISRASKASISATPAVYGGDTTVTFYPGRYMGKELAVQITCYQEGVAVATTFSYFLDYAIQNQIPGYELVGDHYVIVMGPLSWPSYVGGGAECEAVGIHYSNRPTPVARGSFPLSAQ